MLLSWLRVLVYDWVTLLQLALKPPLLPIFAYLPALPSISQYLHEDLHQFFFHDTSLWLLSFAPLSFLPSRDSLISSLSLSICFLLLQSFIYSASCTFSSQPDLLLTDSVWFYNPPTRKKTRLFIPPSSATNSAPLFVSALSFVQR